MLYYREISERIKRLASTFPAVALTGSRQTGKTTLLKAIFKEHNYVSLDLPRHSQLAEQEPEEFLRQFPPPVLIDEVQYAPGLFRHLKIAIDQNREQNGQFILTGSQKFTLMKEISDSLAGRIGLCELENLKLSELKEVGKNFVAEHSHIALMVRGMFPQLWKDSEVDTLDFYSSYIATYLERDVRQIINVVSLRDFERFMRATALRAGQLLNKSEIAREVGITQGTCNDWLGVLAATNQIYLLEPYFGNLGKRLIKSPKLYFADTGTLCALLGLSEVGLKGSYLLGAIWENFVYSELRKSASLDLRNPRLWFYRDKQREVDFVLESEGQLALAETKWTELPSVRAFANLKEVASRLPNSSQMLRVICRTASDFPVSENCWAINGLSLDLVRWYGT